MADIDVLKEKLNDIGEAIRSKTAQVELLSLDEMPDAIRSISGGGGLPSQTKTVTPTASGLTVTPDSGYTLSKVTVNGDTDLTPSNVKSGVEIFGVQGELEPALPTQEKSVTPTKNGVTVTPDDGYSLSKVTVDGDSTFIPANIRNSVKIFGVQGTLVPAKVEQEKTTDPSTSTVEVTPDTNKVLSKVTVNPIPTEIKTVSDLDLSSGIGMISPTSGKFMSQVMIPKPAELIPENIKEGVSIFNVLGNYSGGGGGETRAKVYPITLSSNLTSQQAIIMPDSTLAAHVNDESLVCTMIPLFEDTTYHSIRGLTQTNKLRGYSYYGAAWYCSSSYDSFNEIATPLNATSGTASPCLTITSVGMVLAKGSNSRYFGAGDWLIVIAW